VSKPLMFIGSSTQSKPFANALQECVSDELTPILWSQLGLPLSEQVLAGLENKLDRADFAAFILAPDDEIKTNGKTARATRDNVLIEYGLARGLLGKERVFMVMPPPAEIDFHLPTDLAGLTGSTYDAQAAITILEKPEELQTILLDAANEIRRETRVQGPKPRDSKSEERRVEKVLDRGSTDALSELADAAIYVSDKRNEYPESLRQFVKDRKFVPSKYLYWTPQASEHWLELCNQEKYQYYSNSLEVLRKKAQTLAGQIVAAAGTAQIDFVSVGSGDGVKDNVLLRQLQKELREEEFVYYYPVDISDTLIVEAIRNALRGGLPRGRFKVKALIADFLKLEKLKAFYEERPAPNLFSVLGNTVGNADEDKLLDSVSEAMMPGDLVLLEVNVGDPSIDDLVWSDPVTLEHDFTPLAVLNVDFEPHKMEYSEHQGEGIVKGTSSIVASYKEAMIDKENLVTDVKLSVVRYYNQENFLTAVQQRMNVEEVWSEAVGDVFLMLAKREEVARKA
jgi:uncharacterized SAM-dependent methyltransferase